MSIDSYEREQRQLREGFHCRVKDEPVGRTYRRVKEYGITEQMEVWK